ncbi:phosphatase 2C-like domain-containing protein [Aspergillus egyptiacus]|nr:phosphatase 2C-like domain-containing protein [Aspergillus egyptiacus]
MLLEAVGARSERGGRPTQRDFYSIVMPGQIPGRESENLAFFAVYDGHGSDTVSKHAKKHLAGLLFETAQLKSGDYEGAVKEAIRLEESLLHTHRERKYGSTVALCLIDLETGLLVTGNLGHSHILLAELGGPGRSMAVRRLTESHTPCMPSERRRILAAGGSITVDEDGTHRLGPLSMSRALGNLELKESFRRQSATARPISGMQATSADEEGPLSGTPFVTSTQLHENCQYHIALITDGVANRMDDGTVMSKIADYWRFGEKAQDISKHITLQVSQVFGSDNTTCITVFLKGCQV